MAPAPTERGEQEQDARTVFVRNVAFDVTDGGLEEVFGDVGPVRQCFLVKSKGEAKHRGFGFVQFAIPEDAQRAVAELNGRELAGRKLKVGPDRLGRDPARLEPPAGQGGAWRRHAAPQLQHRAGPAAAAAWLRAALATLTPHRRAAA